MQLFDTHAHYYDERFDADRDEVLTDLANHGVILAICPGCDVPSSRQSLELAQKWPFLYAAVGIHPEDCAGTSEEDFSVIRERAGNDKVVAIGEIGLDYYWKENPPRDFQQMVFHRQMEMAEELHLPVIIHDREAHGDSMDVVRAHPNVTGVFHCYSGSVEMAEELLSRGWYLGFDGPVTYKNARKAPEVIRITPLDRILIETDSPYMSPEPFRGHRNDSRYVYRVAEAIATMKGISAEEVASASLQNGKRLFSIL